MLVSRVPRGNTNQANCEVTHEACRKGVGGKGKKKKGPAVEGHTLIPLYELVLCNTSNTYVRW
jgi:hypothetical protein